MRNCYNLITGMLCIALAAGVALAFEGPNGLMEFRTARNKTLAADNWVFQHLFDVDTFGVYSGTVSYGEAHGGGLWKAPAIGDVDNDGGIELVVFYNYESATGNDYSFGHMWDIAPDGTLDNHFALNDFGSNGWYMDGRTLQPVIGDFDNDGTNELLTAHNWGGYHGTAQGARIYQTELNTNGTTVPGTWSQLADWVGDGRNYSLGIGDLNNDAMQDLVVAYNYPNFTGTHMNYGWLWTYDATGTRIVNQQIIDWSSDWLADIDVGDVDGDGTQELVIMRNYLTENPEGTDMVYRLAYHWTGTGIGDAVELAGGAWLNERFCTVALAHFTPADCADVWQRGQGLAADINQDCYVNFLDFAMMAGQWLDSE